MAKATPIFVRLPIKIELDEGLHVASSLDLDIHSPGRTEQEAEINLIEEIGIFLRECFEMGTLHDVLVDCGFEFEEGEEGHPIVIDGVPQERTINVPVGFLAKAALEASVGKH